MRDEETKEPRSRSEGARRSWQSPTVRARRIRGIKAAWTRARRRAMARLRREQARRKRESRAADTVAEARRQADG